MAAGDRVQNRDLVHVPVLAQFRTDLAIPRPIRRPDRGLVAEVVLLPEAEVEAVLIEPAAALGAFS